MVQGMAFLSKKRFNPTNRSNQKAVWEAQQHQELEKKRIRERNDQLKREREDEELARARGGARGGNEAALRFMYGPPPGLPGATKESTDTDADLDSAPSKDVTTTTNSDVMVMKRQPGDDDAAAAFRQMLAANAPTQEAASADNTGHDNVSSISGAALAGTTIEAATKGNENLSALEKAVGRRDANRSLTLEEQIARFPQLKNAPMAKGMSSTNVNVNFKPLGTQLEHIRCLACGVWGHSRGDRECELSGWNPFATSIKPRAAANGIDALARGNSESGDVSRMKKHDHRDDELDKKIKSDNSGSGEEDSRRRRKKKKHKSSSRHRKHESKRRRRSRSSSPEDGSRKRSHKKRRKHSSRHDD